MRIRNPERRLQWEMSVQIFHYPGFWRGAEVSTLKHDWYPIGEARWNGIGVPSDVFQSLDALVLGVLHDHLVTRYGVQGTLPFSPPVA